MKAKNGFVLGKFMPPHKGHVFLCDFARAQCEHLTILVCSLPNDPIPGELRYGWMKAMFPDCTVVWCNEIVPQEPKDENDTRFWDIWRDIVLRYSYGGQASRCDAIFASESYGHRLAHEMGARFVPCDMARLTVPVSGTACRDDPWAQWLFLPDIIKPCFLKRVTLFGPESSGKSTLAAQLSQRYATVMVPEYGRTYTETFGIDLVPNDLLNIVAGHRASVAAAAALSGPILIEDTDPVMTAVWSDMLFGTRDPFFASFNDYADLYLLCDIDFPWENDGTRYFAVEADRQRFFRLCEAELIARGVTYVIVSGDRERRLKDAVTAIDTRFHSPALHSVATKR